MAEEYEQSEDTADISDAAVGQEKMANELAARQQAEQERQASEAEAEKNKPVPISLGLFIPLLILNGIGDIIDFFTAGTIGWLIGLFISGINMITLGLSKSGRKQFKAILIGTGIETVPIIGSMLPGRTGALIWAFIKSRSTIAATISSKIATKAA